MEITVPKGPEGDIAGRCRDRAAFFVDGIFRGIEPLYLPYNCCDFKKSYDRDRCPIFEYQEFNPILLL